MRFLLGKFFEQHVQDFANRAMPESSNLIICYFPRVAKNWKCSDWHGALGHHHYGMDFGASLASQMLHAKSQIQDSIDLPFRLFVRIVPSVLRFPMHMIRKLSRAVHPLGLRALYASGLIRSPISSQPAIAPGWLLWRPNCWIPYCFSSAGSKGTLA